MIWGSLFLALLALCSLAYANTEIKHFRPARQTPEELLLSQAERNALASTLVPSMMTSLAGPYTTIEFETISYQQNINSENKERWYCLSNLVHDKSYELRVSYAATTPSDFELTLFSFSELMAHFGKPLDLDMDSAAQKRLEGSKPRHHAETTHSTTTVMYARIRAMYTGFSAVPGMENQAVPYMLTLEKHVLGLPAQALWLVAVLLVVVPASIYIVSPWILSICDGLIAEEKREALRKSD
ncbi:hypothetical protein IWW48_004922 [Coemansia sp. RSA 1200]|nr:hypothetical protein IWW48_004922 [Coemansia sp. RSA 1200]